ncbi:MAG: metalloregulator ArsR/SmtB family transcription factor [bacterium]|nr:metalloregulator ArsR/SmtB family transcription factor [bacterium]
MASIQRIGFTRYQNDLSKIFKALGHPARIAIIDLLLDKQRISCKQLATEIGFGSPTVSHHLKMLMDSGLIGYQKNANISFYVVNPLLVQMANEALRNVSQKAETNDINFRDVIFNQQPMPDSF